MRLQILCTLTMVSALAHGEGGAVLSEALVPFSEVAGPASVDLATATLGNENFWLLALDSEALVAVLSSGLGLATTGLGLEAVGQATARRRYRDAASEGSARLTAGDERPIGHADPTGSLRLVAGREREHLAATLPGREFDERQLTALIVAKSRWLESSPE